jgi:hypothetical protein
MLTTLILLCILSLGYPSRAAEDSASTFAGATTTFQYPPNATAVPSSYFPDEYQVGYGGSTPSTSNNSYIIKFN